MEQLWLFLLLLIVIILRPPARKSGFAELLERVRHHDNLLVRRDDNDLRIVLVLAAKAHEFVLREAHRKSATKLARCGPDARAKTHLLAKIELASLTSIRPWADWYVGERSAVLKRPANYKWIFAIWVAIQSFPFHGIVIVHDEAFGVLHHMICVRLVRFALIRATVQ